MAAPRGHDDVGRDAALPRSRSSRTSRRPTLMADRARRGRAPRARGPARRAHRRLRRLRLRRHHLRGDHDGGSCARSAARSTPLLASRFDGGYGLSRGGAATRPRSRRDACSSPATAARAITRARASARARGIDAIVIDHHLVPDEPLPALAFLNPHRPECGFPYKGLASCGLALSLGAAVRAALGQTLDLRPWLDLVAIGTIADVAPLDGDNRALVRAGPRRARRAARAPASARSPSYAKIDGCAPPRRAGRRVPHRAAPQRARPARRAGSLARAAARAPDEAAGRARRARSKPLSERRRAIQEAMLVEADRRDRARAATRSAPAIVVGREGWHPGVVGIVAGRLADRYARPSSSSASTAASGAARCAGRGLAAPRRALEPSPELLVASAATRPPRASRCRRSGSASFARRFEGAVEAQGAVPSVDDPGRTPVRLVPGGRPVTRRARPRAARAVRAGQSGAALRRRGAVHEAREVRGGHLKLELSLGRRVAA